MPRLCISSLPHIPSTHVPCRWPPWQPIAVHEPSFYVSMAPQIHSTMMRPMFCDSSRLWRRKDRIGNSATISPVLVCRAFLTESLTTLYPDSTFIRIFTWRPPDRNVLGPQSSLVFNLAACNESGRSSFGMVRFCYGLHWIPDLTNGSRSLLLGI